MSVHPYLRHYAASHLKSAMFQGMGQNADEAIKNIGQIAVKPLSYGGGAAIGGVAGAAGGGLVGLLRAALDSEDDDLGSTARKALHDGFVGGVGGAAVGATGAHVKLNQILDNIEEQRKQSPFAGLSRGDPETLRKVLDHSLRRVEVPVGPAIKRMTGGDPQEFSKAVGETNGRAAMLQMLAAALGTGLAKGPKAGA